MRTPCGLRTVVTVLETFAELLGDAFGKVPCYNTVENWVKKLGLSVYQDDQPCKDKKFAMVVDESIAINGQKLLLTLGIPSEHQGRPLRHADVTVLDMSVSKGFNGDDVQGRIEAAEKSAGNAPDYIISDNGHNLVKGITGSGHVRHADISHSMGVILKKVYEKQPDFVELTTLLGKKRLQYHLTDKAYLLSPNMRAMSRFMNMSSWVSWGNGMLNCYDTLPEKMQEAYAFIKDYECLLRELQAVLCAVRHVETVCKNEGFSVMTSRRCKLHIVTHVLGDAHSRQARIGMKMLEYFNREETLITANMSINISSDIIESTFGIYKSKKSPNKLHGVTSFVLTIPLYSKVTNQSVTKTINFKERIVNVKLKDIRAWSTEHLSTNWVTERTKTLRKAS